MKGAKDTEFPQKNNVSISFDGINIENVYLDQQQKRNQERERRRGDLKLNLKC